MFLTIIYYKKSIPFNLVLQGIYGYHRIKLKHSHTSKVAKLADIAHSDIRTILRKALKSNTFCKLLCGD